MTQTVLLGDEIELAYGKSLPQRDRITGSFPVFGSNGQVDSHNKALVKGPGIIVGRKGSVGEVIWTSKDFWPIDTTYYVKLKNADDSLKYWYYQLKTLGLTHLNSHSAIPGLNRDVAYAKPIIKRPPDEQDKIAYILEKVDEKIELNRRMNETLEQMGQALFKRYFIDNPEVKNWSNGKVGDFASVKSGYAFKGSAFGVNGDYPVVKIKNISDSGVNVQDVQYVSEEDLPRNYNSFLAKGGDILIAMSGNTTGKIGLMPMTNKEYLINQRVGKYYLKSEEQKGFLYFYLRNGSAQEDIIQAAYGSAQPNISPKQLENQPAIIPDKKLLVSVGSLLNGLIEKVVNYNYENDRLEKLRDSLLPRIISGKIKV